MGTERIPCPYRNCRGDRGHGTPHLFEAPDIDKFELDAVAQERDAIAALFWKKPKLTRDALVAAIKARGKE